MKKTNGNQMRWIMGKHAIQETLKRSPKRLIEVYTHKKEDPFNQELAKKRVPIFFLQKEKMSARVRSDSHQGFIAKVSEKGFLTAREFLQKEGENGLVLMCDAIQDPHNFGAILRAAECFGVNALIYSIHKNVTLTPVVSKVSVGASELVPLIPVSNLGTTLKIFKEADYMVVATEISKRAEPLTTFTFPKKTLLIVGSEGRGIQSILTKQSDRFLYIPMRGSIDSLNVSQATAVFLSHWCAQSFSRV